MNQNNSNMCGNISSILWFLLGSLLALSIGCTEPDVKEIGTQNEGESCKRVSDCKPGLKCSDKKCVPVKSLFNGPQRGDPCNVRSDCCKDPNSCMAGDLFCGPQDVCSLYEGRDLGGACGLTDDCLKPYVCSGVDGICVVDTGQLGTAGVGESCTQLSDCQKPLVCPCIDPKDCPDATCAVLPIMTGPYCPRSAEDVGAFRPYFEIPPATPEDDEFYRLPFPSDVRVADGHVSLAGHPAPANAFNLDLRSVYFAAVEQDFAGFPPNPTVFFQFSAVVDRRSVCLDSGSIYPAAEDAEDAAFCETPGEASVYLINIDPDSGTAYGERQAVQLNMSKKAGQYICANWLGMAPLDGQPLRHDTTYAAIITTTVSDVGGAPAIMDKDLLDIVNGDLSEPRMQPLLDAIDAGLIDKDKLAGATVFTTGNPDAIAPKLYQAVNNLSAPAFDNNDVLCGSGASPCDDGLTIGKRRGCFGTHPNFYEIQGTYQGPIFQQGTRPFLNAVDGGALVLNANGDPQIQTGSEAMCYALAIPKGTPPVGGFPVVIYGHGTGGNYRSFVEEGLAEELTNLGFAVIGFDNVMHGPRQFPQTGTVIPFIVETDPGRLFFNLFNPRASRDNILQGAADLFQLLRLVRKPGAASTLPAPEGAFSFDGDHIFYLGHSQGTVIAPAFLSADTNLKGAVLSGAGAEVALSILYKKKPSNSGDAAAVFFGDKGLSRIHPMMGILAMIFAPADAVSFAATWVLDPVNRSAGLPLMQISGKGDSYTPDQAQAAQIRAAGLPLVGTVIQSLPGVSEVNSPQSNNVNGVTAGAVQFMPNEGDDGHFVIFDQMPAKVSLDNFFSSAKTGTLEIQR